jgi:tripartite-type tricarboxylate transporter receptor subunit TctC
MCPSWIARITFMTLLMGTWASAAPDALAQGAAGKGATFIVPFGPGTGNDVVARILAQKMVENGGPQIVVENRPGATGGIGLEYTAKATPNGSTYIIASTSQIVAQFVAKVRYDIIKDFAPVSVAGTLPYVLAVASSSPAKSIADLVALAKTRPGKMSYSGGMIGGLPQFMGVMLTNAHNLDLIMVPYKSTTDAQSDVFAGRVDIWFTTMASALPQAKNGKVRILGVSGATRAALLPDVPTMSEAGIPTVDGTVLFFILVPATTPKPAIQTLNAQIVEAIKAKDVQERLRAAGVEPASSTPEELDALLKRDVARWSKVIKDSGVHLD